VLQLRWNAPRLTDPVAHFGKAYYHTRVFRLFSHKEENHMSKLLKLSIIMLFALVAVLPTSAQGDLSDEEIALLEKVIAAFDHPIRGSNIRNR
jgi:hypothetical protein